MRTKQREQFRQTDVKTKRKLKVWVKIFIFLIGFSIFSVITLYNSARNANKPSLGGIDTTEVSSNLDELDETAITESSGANITYSVLNVGYGEAIFIQYKDKEVLIDCGPEDAGAEIVKKIKNLIQDNLDYVIITSNHPGRIGGIKTIYDELKVDTTILGEMGANDVEIRRNIGTNGKIIDGSEKTIDLGTKCTLTILKPENNSTNRFDKSLMTYLQYDDVEFFAESDAGVLEEERVTGKIEPGCIFVAAGNGKDAGNKLIKTLKPSFTLISSAKNSSYPEAAFLERFAESPKSLFATYDVGDLTFTSNGSTIKPMFDVNKYLLRTPDKDEDK